MSLNIDRPGPRPGDPMIVGAATLHIGDRSEQARGQMGDCLGACYRRLAEAGWRWRRRYCMGRCNGDQERDQEWNGAAHAALLHTKRSVMPEKSSPAAQILPGADSSQQTQQ